MPFWARILLQVVSLGGSAIADRVKENKANRAFVAAALAAEKQCKLAAEASKRTEDYLKAHVK